MYVLSISTKDQNKSLENHIILLIYIKFVICQKKIGFNYFLLTIIYIIKIKVNFFLIENIETVFLLNIMLFKDFLTSIH